LHYPLLDSSGVGYSVLMVPGFPKILALRLGQSD
jgi:hypothetical protein